MSISLGPQDSTGLLNPTGYIQSQKPIINHITLGADAADANIALSAAQIKAGWLKHATLTANRTVTFPAAAVLFASYATNGVILKVGDLIPFKYVRGAGAFTGTLTPSADITLDAEVTTNAAVAANTSISLLIMVTNVTAGTEAAIVYKA